MKRVVLVIASVVVFFGMAFAQTDDPDSTSLNDSQTIEPSRITQPAKTTQKAEKITPTCDGTTVTRDCVAEGITYSTYIYHPAVSEKTHTETVTTYRQKVTGYCTLCNDGTYSPSCATGRGACSHHGGVAQWNAPRYSSIPEYTTKTVVDAPARKAYYEKVAR